MSDSKLTLSEEIRIIAEDCIQASLKAARSLVKVLETELIVKDKDPLAAEKMKQAASAKRLAQEDCFSILSRAQLEANKLEEGESDEPVAKKKKEPTKTDVDFAEGRAK